MLGTIQFDHHFCLVAVKICDVISYNVLSAEAEWVAA